nr:polyamine oxidase splice variant 13 [Homo sapiens]
MESTGSVGEAPGGGHGPRRGPHPLGALLRWRGGGGRALDPWALPG